MFHVVFAALPVFLALAVVPVLDGAVVAGYAAVYLCGLAAVGAGEVLARKVTVGGAYGVCGREGIVGQPVVVRNGLYQLCGGFPAGQLLA